MSRPTAALGLAAALLAAALAGCRSAPLETRQFLLAVPRADGSADRRAEPVAGAPDIHLDRVRVNPVVEQSRIVVRGGPGGREVRWLDEGFARWVLLPGDMIHETVIRELRESGRFDQVLLTGGRAADYSLRLELTTLEVVAREDGAAEAVCELDALLLRRSTREGEGRETEAFWTGRRAGSAALADNSVEAAVVALGQALEQALRGPEGILSEVYARAVALPRAKEPAPEATKPPAPGD